MDESRDFANLIFRCQDVCLWHLRQGKLPVERQAQIYLLDCVERYGNRADFIEARKLKQWLLLHSSEAFAVS
jgi:hypothetical protein